GMAQAQPRLGTPVNGAENPVEPCFLAVPPANSVEPTRAPFAPSSATPVAASSADCRCACKPKPTFPILANIARAFTPGQATVVNTPPPAVDDVPSRQELARMIVDGTYSPAEISAARIKIDESQAKARRAAVKYLAIIDCHYY